MQDDYLAKVRRYYPTAERSQKLAELLLKDILLRTRLKPNQVLAAYSVCSDDVNSMQFPDPTKSLLGPFNLGGLDGYPFTGLTGMGAFAHHVPDEGAVLIFYAPHIGVSADGKLGEIKRVGQSHNSSCCGAAKGALDKLTKKQIFRGDTYTADYQMNSIEQLFLAHEDRIKKAQFPIREATEVMYEAIDQRINALVAQTKFHGKYLILAGGIFINGDGKENSFGVYKRYDVVKLEDHSRVDMLKVFEKECLSI
jgi:hypothetical protein